MPHLPRHPTRAQPGILRDRPEHPPHVVIIHRRPHRRREHQPVIPPQRPGRQPVLGLPHPVLPQRLHTLAWQRQRPPRLRRLGVTPGPISPPHEHRHLLVIEPCLRHRNPLPGNPCHHV